MKLLGDKLKLRLYQESILNTASQKNTLVIIPTGLGKTHIAIGLSGLRLKEGKILFLAPTKPLVTQHLETFSEYFAPKKDMAVLTGEIAPSKRKEIWEKSKIIFSTPQTIKFDLISNRLDLRDVNLIIFDEAHKCVGDYSYVFLAKAYLKQAKDPRILALTASPGTDEGKINEICSNLFVEKIEARNREHEEIRPYVKPIFTNYQFVELPEEIKNIKNRLEIAIRSRLGELKHLGYVQTTDITKYSKKNLLALQANLHGLMAQREYHVGRALSVCAAIIKATHALNLLTSESMEAVEKYFDEIWRQSKTSKTRAVKDLVQDFQIRAAYSLIKRCIEKGIENPKIDALKNIVERQIRDKKYAKILIFTEFRSNIKKIIETLESIKGVAAHKFIGQANRAEKGMDQKTQSEVLHRFREGEINCLIATSVAEEGLDIPQVDLVVFYSPVPSAIKTIQRRGRTGRQEVGKLSVLMAKGTKDEAYYWIARRGEQHMNSAIRSVQDRKENRLDNYFVKAEKEKPEELVKIFADVREQGDVIEHLFDKGVRVKTSQLKVGDFILSEDVGIERKNVKDFAISLIDKRLFSQAKNLKENFNKPLFIVEGDLEEMFKARGIHPNALRASMISLLLDWQVPILFSSSSMETAELLSLIAKREQLDQKKEVGIRGKVRPGNLAEQQEFFVSGLPAVGPNLAKALLKKFKTPKKIVNAKLDKLKKVEKIGDKKAEQIRKLLDDEYKN